MIFSAIRWLNYDWKNRQNYIPDILKCIRFKLLPGHQLAELNKLSKSKELCSFFQSTEIQYLIYDALMYNLISLYISEPIIYY